MLFNTASGPSGRILTSAAAAQVASPDWSELRQRVQWLWPVHAYGLACLFLGLAVTAFLTALGLRARLSARPHLSTLNVFLLVLGLTRCLCLFLDPYGSRQVRLLTAKLFTSISSIPRPCFRGGLLAEEMSVYRKPGKEKATRVTGIREAGGGVESALGTSPVLPRKGAEGTVHQLRKCGEGGECVASS